MKKLLLITFLFLGLGGYSQTKNDTILNETKVEYCCGYKVITTKIKLKDSSSAYKPLTPEQKRKSRRITIIGVSVFVLYTTIGVLLRK